MCLWDSWDFNLWRWLSDNTEARAIESIYYLYSSRGRGTHGGPRGQHQGKSAVGQGAETGARGKPGPQPLLGFPLGGQGRPGKQVGIGWVSNGAPGAVSSHLAPGAGVCRAGGIVSGV